MLKIVSFILDIIPFVGSLKMFIEACVGKEMTGVRLIGNARTIHFVFAILSLALDIITFGIGGSIGRALAKVLGKGFLQRGATRAGESLAARATLQTGKKAAFQAGVGTGLKHVGTALYKANQTFLGRRAVNYTERKVRKGTEHTIESIRGYRLSSNKRDEMREKYGKEAKTTEEMAEIKKNEKEEKAMGYFQRKYIKNLQKRAGDYYEYDTKKGKLNPINYE